MSLYEMVCQPTPTDREGVQKVVDEAIPVIQAHLKKMEHLRRFEDVLNTLIRNTIKAVMEEERKTVDLSTIVHKITRLVMQELKMEEKSEKELKRIVDNNLHKIRMEPKNKVEIGKGKNVAKNHSEETMKWIISLGCVYEAIGYRRIVENVTGFYEVILNVLNEVAKVHEVVEIDDDDDEIGDNNDDDIIIIDDDVVEPRAAAPEQRPGDGPQGAEGVVANGNAEDAVAVAIEDVVEQETVDEAMLQEPQMAQELQELQERQLVVPKKRGRPPGSGQKKKSAAVAPKKRGRPPGSGTKKTSAAVAPRDAQRPPRRSCVKSSVVDADDNAPGPSQPAGGPHRIISNVLTRDEVQKIRQKVDSDPSLLTHSARKAWKLTKTLNLKPVHRSAVHDVLKELKAERERAAADNNNVQRQ